jgi:stage V sporulation protein AE
VPLTGFGYSLANGVKKAVTEHGILGALMGGLEATAAGITASVFFGFLSALFFKPDDKT